MKKKKRKKTHGFRLLFEVVIQNTMGCAKQSALEEINTDSSLEGTISKQKLAYFGHDLSMDDPVEEMSAWQG